MERAAVTPVEAPPVEAPPVEAPPALAPTPEGGKRTPEFPANGLAVEADRLRSNCRVLLATASELEAIAARIYKTVPAEPGLGAAQPVESSADTGSQVEARAPSPGGDPWRELLQSPAVQKLLVAVLTSLLGTAETPPSQEGIGSAGAKA